MLAAACMHGGLAHSAPASWITEGFDAFRRGTFGNSGQNLYVSRKGVLQRIHLFDLDHNGYLDLPYANCQDHHESAPSYIYSLDGTRLASLPGAGAVGGTALDLNGDGLLDIVVCGNFDMVQPFAPSDIYYGSKDGEYSERHHIRIQTPFASDCWHGDFDRSGRPSLVFALPRYRIVRVYPQDDLGFAWERFTDLDIDAELLTVADLDGDGYDDLVTRKREETRTEVFWGGKGGLDASRRTVLPELDPGELLQPEEEATLESELEQKFESPRLLQTVVWNGKPCFTLSTGKKIMFFAAGKDRKLHREFELEVPMALAVAAADLNGDGLTDLALACRVKSEGDAKRQSSFIWLNSAEGFKLANRIAVDTASACCVDARPGMALFGQCAAGRRYTNDALLFTFKDGRLASEPRRFQGEDMRRAFLVDLPNGDTGVFLVNHFSRSSVGFDKAFVYWGRKEGYNAGDRLEVPAWCAVDTLPADFDDDGWAELLVCNNSENSMHLDPGHHLHKFGPGGFLPDKTTLLRTDGGWGAIAGDFDKDGYLDIITSADHWFALRYFRGGPDGFKGFHDIEVQPDDDPEMLKSEKRRRELNKKSGNPLSRIRHEKSGSARWPIAVDVDMDGWLDIVVPMIGFGRSHILWGGPEGYSMARRKDLAAYNCVSARAADLDGNGYPDIILGGHTSQHRGEGPFREPHHSYIHIYWNGPDGLSESRKTILRCDAGDSMALADYNRDGTLDIFVGSYLGEVDRDINSFLYWNRKGRFSEFDRQELFTHAVSGCIPGDFNGDGYVDLAVANHKVYGDHVGNSYVWWNGPEGFVPTRRTALPTCGPHGMCTYEPGNQMTRGPEEYYYSEPYSAQEDLKVKGAEVSGEIPPKTWVKVVVRVADTKDALEKAAWHAPEGVSVRSGAYLQYRLELGATLSLRTPRITKVEISFQQ